MYNRGPYFVCLHPSIPSPSAKVIKDIREVTGLGLGEAIGMANGTLRLRMDSWSNETFLALQARGLEVEAAGRVLTVEDFDAPAPPPQKATALPSPIGLIDQALERLAALEIDEDDEVVHLLRQAREGWKNNFPMPWA